MAFLNVSKYDDRSGDNHCIDCFYYHNGICVVDENNIKVKKQYDECNSFSLYEIVDYDIETVANDTKRRI